MSATRSRSQGAGHSGPPAVLLSPPAVAGRPRLLTAVVVLAVAGSLALLAMDLWTSNPQVVSRDQILKADAVVVARRTSAGSLRIERVFHGELAEGDEISV